MTQTMWSGRCELQTLKTLYSIDLQLQFVAMSMKAAITSTNTMLTSANFMAQYTIWCAIFVHMIPNVAIYSNFIRILFYFHFYHHNKDDNKWFSQQQQQHKQHQKYPCAKEKYMLCMRCDHNETISSTKPISNETI